MDFRIGKENDVEWMMPGAGCAGSWKGRSGDGNILLRDEPERVPRPGVATYVGVSTHRQKREVVH